MRVSIGVLAPMLCLSMVHFQDIISADNVEEKLMDFSSFSMCNWSEKKNWLRIFLQPPDFRKLVLHKFSLSCCIRNEIESVFFTIFEVNVRQCALSIKWVAKKGNVKMSQILAIRQLHIHSFSPQMSPEASICGLLTFQIIYLFIELVVCSSR